MEAEQVGSYLFTLVLYGLHKNNVHAASITWNQTS